MKMPIRLPLSLTPSLRLLGSAAALAAGLGFAVIGTADAETYPTKPIKIISPFSAGSPPDAFGRLIAQQLAVSLGQSVVVENRPGAGTTLGTKAGAMADPDGTTLLQANAALTYAPDMYPNSGYDPVKSFAPVALLATWTHVLSAHSSIAANNLQELLAYAKANPGKLNMGFPLGSPPHLLSEMLRMETGADFNSVPYRQTPQLVSDFVAGRVQVYFNAGEPLATMIREGKIKAYAVTGASRDANLANVPTMAEAGLPRMTVNPSDWTGLLAPAGTPPAVIQKLNAAINDAVKSAETQAALAKLGSGSKLVTPQEFAAFVSADAAKWPPIVKAAGLKVD
jgi:tripartite-type tricarboxylate transporter receptor subunit TctC